MHWLISKKAEGILLKLYIGLWGHQRVYPNKAHRFGRHVSDDPLFNIKLLASFVYHFMYSTAQCNSLNFIGTFLKYVFSGGPKREMIVAKGDR